METRSSSSAEPTDVGDEIILSVYFCGTDHNLSRANNDLTYLAARMAVLDKGTELNPGSPFYKSHYTFNNTNCRYKMSFNGCGVEYGITGTLFGTGLDEQCQKVVTEIANIRKTLEEENLKKRIVINCYGHSRGGIAALMLAKMLGHYPVDLVEVNLAMLDPVPGNLITSSTLDIFECTLANQVINLENCRNLNRVICLYPYEPMPDIKFHAPLIPTYPQHTLVEQDIVLGCHSQGEFLKSSDNEVRISDFTAPRFVTFMKACKTRFTEPPTNKTLNEDSYDKLLETEREKQKYLPPNDVTITREAHSESPSQISAKGLPSNSSAKYYVNRHHEFLVTGKSNIKSRGEEPRLQATQDTLETLLALIRDVESSMTTASKNSSKGDLLRALREKLETEKEKAQDETIPNLATESFRMLCNIALQRDRCTISLFTTTTSGDKLKNLLLDKKYKCYADLVAGKTGHKPRYRDLRDFTGHHEASHFHANNRDQNYSKLNSAIKPKK